MNELRASRLPRGSPLSVSPAVHFIRNLNFMFRKLHKIHARFDALLFAFSPYAIEILKLSG